MNEMWIWSKRRILEEVLQVCSKSTGRKICQKDVYQLYEHRFLVREIAEISAHKDMYALVGIRPDVEA